ncbi:MAG TPA: MAPEG family protein [Novosphingobium sp.]|nr:MAPEG family protein [Novosphingobium sp.]HZV08141.1 MAPEG family protein [Novosphingobium sp.]
MLLPTTLCLAAAAAVVNFWLGLRIMRLRMARKIFMGDGADPAIVARMRAQANFIENTPITLILFGAVEALGGAHLFWGGAWLAPLGAIFMLGRVAHAFGMDGRFKPGRPIGMLTTLFTQIVLAVVAVLASTGRL